VESFRKEIRVDMSGFTRRVEECKRRWNRRTLQYVLAVARIVLRAKKAAGNRRRWTWWIHHDLRMDRSTIQRYLRIESFVRANDDLNHHFHDLTISKLYALSRLPLAHARRMLVSGKVSRGNDLEFLRMARRLIRRRPYRTSVENLTRQMDAAVRRIELSVQRWRTSKLEIPPVLSARLRRQLYGIARILERIKIRTTAV
jgi:hypothetical protein